MVYTDYKKPTKNMLISESELSRMSFEHEQAVYENDKMKRELAESAAERERREHEKKQFSVYNDRMSRATKRVKFMEATKNAFVSEGIMKIYEASCVTPMSESDRVVARNLINKFVIENGATALITRFSTKNFLLSEVSRICSKYINKVLESCECGDSATGEAKEFVVDDQIRDGFFEELEDVDTDDASKLIKERVSDAMSDFVDSNMSNKLEYEDVLKTAQDKMAVADDAAAEAYSMRARRKVNEMKSARVKNVFHCLVEGLTKASLNDPDLKAKYVHEASVDMDGIVNSAQLLYTMLEMVNTTEMATVNEEFISNYIESLNI